MNYDSKILSDLFRRYSVSVNNDYSRLYQTDALVRRIIDTYPDSAYSTGFEIRGPDSETYDNALDALGLWEVFRHASIWARLHGLCAVLMKTNGARLDTPINGTLIGLAIYPLSHDTELDGETIKIGTNDVHTSRLLLFKGQEVYSDLGYLKVSYRSVLDGLIEILHDFQRIGPVAMKLMRTSNQVSIGTAGLSASIRNDIMAKTNTAQQQIMSRLDSINAGRDVSEVILYDKDNEIIGNTPLSLSGIGDLYAILENQLALRSDYPKTVLFGRNDASNMGSGSVAQLVTRMEWATRLASWIDSNWTDHIEYICEYLRRTLNLSAFDIDVPLSLIISPDEQAVINKAQAETLIALSGIYPMGTKEIKQYVDDNFTNLSLPEIPDAPPVDQSPQAPDPNNPDPQMDSIDEFANINSAVVDDVMRRIAAWT